MFPHLPVLRDEALHKFLRGRNAAAVGQRVEAGLLQCGLPDEGGVAQNARRAAVCDEFTVAEDQRPLGVFEHQVHVVGDHHDRDALGVQPPQELHDVGVVAEILVTAINVTSLRFLPAFSHALHIFASTCCRFSCKSIMYTLLLFYNQLVFFYFTAV